jgi:predicted aldo/keto reductase-like oxidoreductase
MHVVWSRSRSGSHYVARLTRFMTCLEPRMARLGPGRGRVPQADQGCLRPRHQHVRVSTRIVSDELLDRMCETVDNKSCWDDSTANVYSNGESERILGKAIKKFGFPRENIVVLTKVRGYRPDRLRNNSRVTHTVLNAFTA